jgi:hypothetical protein
MIDCEERRALREQLDAAFREWYTLKDTPGSENKRAALKAQKKVHHIQRAFVDHCAKHGCAKT